jgi:hypothetical protein
LVFHGGGVVEWWSGGVVEWWSGGREEWWSGGVVEWWSGGVVEWWKRGVVEWGSGVFDSIPPFLHGGWSDGLAVFTLLERLMVTVQFA